MDEKNINQNTGCIIAMITPISMFLLGILAFLFSGCAKTVYVPVESIKTEYRDIIKSDSIIITDSLFFREKGDTILITRWRTEYRDRLRIDSIMIRDSIQVPYPVEKQLSKWQSIKMDIGEIAIGVIACLSFIIIWLIKKRR